MSILEKHGLKINQQMTTPSKIGKKPQPVFVVTGSVLKFEELFRTLGGKKFRGQWSFWNDPTDELTDELEKCGDMYTLDRAFDYKLERKEAKAERLEVYAENAETRSNQASNQAVSMLSCIPSDQPILVGHYSEKSHRRLLEKSDNKMRKAVEESKKADDLAWRAKSLAYDVKKLQSITYLTNKLKENQHLVNKYQAYSEGRYYIKKGFYDTTKEINERQKALYISKMNEYQKLVDFYKKKIEERQKELESEGKFFATPEKIEKGDFIQRFDKWCEVTRVNKLSVTVKFPENNGTFSLYKIPYSKITGIKKKEEMEVC